MKLKNICLDLEGVILKTFGKGKFLQYEQWEDYIRGYSSSEEYLMILSDSLGCSIEDALEFHQSQLTDENKGIFEMIQTLQKDGFQVGGLFNTNELHWELLSQESRYPSISLLSPCLISFEVGMMKPDPIYFEVYELDAGLNPSEIFYFDKVSMNIKVAKERGWNAFLIDSNGFPSEDICRKIYSVSLIA